MSDSFSSSVQFMGTGPEPVFRTIQGEGIRLGRLSTFVRFYGCNQTCEWCDTKQSWKPGPGGGVPVTASAYGRGESGVFSWEDPSNSSALLRYEYRSVSDPMDLVITGGNPMLPEHRRAVSWLVESWSGDVTIETNAYGDGTLPDAELTRAFICSRVVRSVLWSLSPKIREWDDNTVAEYVRFAVNMGHEIQLKIVVTSLNQAQNVFSRIYSLNVPNAALSKIVVILQPEWSLTRTLVPELLAAKVPISLNSGFKDVRVIPQVHKSLRIL